MWIVACLEGDNPGYSSGASIYPAVENMLLATRALGLGSTLTTRHIGYAKECDEAMGDPAELPFLRDPADRLPDGAVRTGWSRAIVRNRLSRRLGQALSRNLINPISGITCRGGGLERQDALGEILREPSPRRLLPEPSAAVLPARLRCRRGFRLIDERRVHQRAGLRRHPGEHRGMRAAAHQLRDDIGVDDDHRSKGANLPEMGSGNPPFSSASYS